MVDFLKENVSQIVEFFLLLLITFVQVIKYYKYSKEVSMKYKTENSVKPTSGETFKSVVPEYQLDEKKNVLIVTGTIDLQELIQSSADCALKAILDKFGGIIPEAFQKPTPPIQEESDEVNVIQIKSDIDKLNDILDFQEGLRERYKFSDGMSLFDMITAIGGMKATVDKKIQSSLEKQAVAVKEAKKDAKA